MTIKINFDVANNPEEPTIVLAKRNGDKLGQIPARSIQLSEPLNDAAEMTFTVYKYEDGKKCVLWDDIVDFKLIYCVEWNAYFEISVELDESSETMKTIACTSLAHAELGQLMLYDIEINTEEVDVARDDYVMPTVLYRENGILGKGIRQEDIDFYEKVTGDVYKYKENGEEYPDYKEASLLHRILKDKAPHYSIDEVSDSIKHIQRTFTFSDKSIYDALQEIAEEINCIFVFNTSDENGNLKRTISVYDLEANCLNPDCQHRDEFTLKCPKCGSENINEGYGDDTTIFVTSDELADNLQITTDTGAVKNCFKLEAGDDLMTATVRNCNPNGSDYIWYFSDSMKADMSEDLVNRIGEYDAVYAEYQNNHSFDLSGEKVVIIETGEAGLLPILTKNINEPFYISIRHSDSYEIDSRNNVVLKGALTENFWDISGIRKLKKRYISHGNNVYYVAYNSDIEERKGSDGETHKFVMTNCYKLSAKEIDLITAYNNLVGKYNDLHENQDDENAYILEEIDSDNIIGFPALIDAYYNAVDFELYLKSSLMPSISMARPDINAVIDNLENGDLSPVATNKGEKTEQSALDSLSVNTANNIVLSMAKTLVDSRYKVKIKDGSYSLGSTYKDDNNRYCRKWTGKFVVTVYSADEINNDTQKETEAIEVIINADYETFIKRKMDKTLSDNEPEDMSIAGLFKKELKDNPDDPEGFQFALREYSLNRLTSFHDACQAVIDILIEQEIGKEGASWSGDDLYKNLYVPYKNKLKAIEAEMDERKSDIDIVAGVYDEDGDVVKHGVKSYINAIKSYVYDALDFQAFIIRDEVDEEGSVIVDGEKLWFEFCSFRRDDKYDNSNYVSDGLDNAALIKRAREFIESAQKEIYKSAELQRSISATLKNLLVIEKFKPLRDYFKVGNYLRVMIDDEVYKLRLIKYDIDYDDMSDISVEFSDVINASNSIKTIQDVMEQASSMATSYSSVKRQASQGEKSNETVNEWISNGLNATNVKIIGGAKGQSQVWDEHGMLFREYDDETGEYSPEQMKIVNSTLAVTDDNWKTTKTAVGKFHYAGSDGGDRVAYGINAETVIGKFILGENMSLQNESGNMRFDGDGLIVTSVSEDGTGVMEFNEDGFVVSHEKEGFGRNTVTISPKNEQVINITHESENGSVEEFFKIEENQLTIDGNIIARSLNLTEGVTINPDVIDKLHPVATSGDYTLLNNRPESLSDFENDKGFITKEVDNLDNYYKKAEIKTVATSGRYDDLDEKPEFKDVATSGKYTDLTGETSDVGKLLYVGNDGKVTSIGINELKELLNA